MTERPQGNEPNAEGQRRVMLLYLLGLILVGLAVLVVVFQVLD